MASASSLYVFDTNSLRVFGNYYPDSFPTFWDQLDHLVTTGLLTSVREVRKELENQNTSEHLEAWINAHEELFTAPSEDEMEVVAEIFRVPHFRQLIGEQQRLKGLPVADPFVVARASILGGIVVTEESIKPHAARIPNVCNHLRVRSTNVKGFLEAQGWKF